MKLSPTNYTRTADWLAACGKEPSEENLSVQIGCQLEEMAEYLECINTGTSTADFTRRNVVYQLRALGEMLKLRVTIAHIPHIMRGAALDALCDIEVTGNGVAFMAGFDKNSADEVVLTSNEDKLVDGKPVLLPGGKIGKPDGWVAPDLSRYV